MLHGTLFVTNVEDVTLLVKERQRRRGADVRPMQSLPARYERLAGDCLSVQVCGVVLTKRLPHAGMLIQAAFPVLFESSINRE